MSLSTQLNDLIYDRLYSEAVSFLISHPEALSPPQTKNLGLLIQSCLSDREPVLAAQVMQAFAPTLTGTNELCLGVAGLLRSKRIDLAKETLLKTTKFDPKIYTIFIEGAIEAKSGPDAMEILHSISPNETNFSLFVTIHTGICSQIIPKSA